MNYATIKTNDIANGPGIRVSLFVSGCTHHCDGCFNAETWDFNYGKPFTQEVEDGIMEELKKPQYQGLTFLGGEPMEPVNQKVLVHVAERFKELYPEKSLWVYSGYLFDRDILGKFAKIYPETMRILKCADVLVDGEFVLAKRNIALLYRGSSNQRLIDVQKSLAAGEVVLWDHHGITMTD